MPAPLETERIEKLVSEYLEQEGYELVDLRVIGSVSHPVIEVFCDIEGGITSDECTKLAKLLRYRLGADGYYNDNTRLMVSSPGLDRVLKTERDFDRFRGKKVTVRLTEKIDGRGKLTGILGDYQDGSVMIGETEEGDIALSPGRWKEIRLVPEYPEGFK